MTDQPDESTVDRAVPRTELRRAMIAARLAIPAERQASASARIRAALETLIAPLPAGLLAFCWPIRAEVDCRPLAERLGAAGWRFAMPVAERENAPMRFHAWWPDAPMTADPYGIPVPATAEAARPDVVLLPLVACDAAGYRLGYGGGYFDRTLATCAPRPLTIGVGFEICVVPTIHPEAHDIPLDCIVTEMGIRKFATP
jgi:5-formyltetrahydrofolate cyclo-ligase